MVHYLASHIYKQSFNIPKLSQLDRTPYILGSWHNNEVTMTIFASSPQYCMNILG